MDASEILAEWYPSRTAASHDICMHEFIRIRKHTRTTTNVQLRAPNPTTNMQRRHKRSCPARTVSRGPKCAAGQSSFVSFLLLVPSGCPRFLRHSPTGSYLIGQARFINNEISPFHYQYYWKWLTKKIRGKKMAMAASSTLSVSCLGLHVDNIVSDYVPFHDFLAVRVIQDMHTKVSHRLRIQTEAPIHGMFAPRGARARSKTNTAIWPLNQWSCLVVVILATAVLLGMTIVVSTSFYSILNPSHVGWADTCCPIL